MLRKHYPASGFRLLLLVLMTIVSAAMIIGHPSTARSADPLPEVVADYTLGPEDILEISVWRNEDLSKIVIVRPDGNISLPLVGDIKAAGLTPEELKKKITDELRKYQETVVVSVIVQEVNSFKVYIHGEIAKPGEYMLRRKTTMQQLIALAGGFSQFASRNKIVLSRLKANSPESIEKMNVRFDDLVYENIMPIILMPGDTIYVP